MKNGDATRPPMGSSQERGNSSCNKRLSTALARLAWGFAQMAFQGGLVVQAGISSGANFAWRLRSLALNRLSLHAAGVRSGALTTHSAHVLA
jgi:hypothetical protein